MSNLKYLSVLIFATFLTSCMGDFKEVVDFKKVENPNITKEAIIGTDNSSSIWLEGTERAMSSMLNRGIVISDLASDNYTNIGTYYNLSIDQLNISVFDKDINSLQLRLAKLREMALIGLNEIGPADKKYSEVIEAEFYFFEGISYLYSGMYFSYLPQSAGSVPVSSEENYRSAIKSFDQAIKKNDKPEYQLAKSRANYFLGDKVASVNAAEKALLLDKDFIRNAKYDVNTLNNTMQSAIYNRRQRDFQPLPSLDFLDPKYSTIKGGELPSIAYLKAEEAYLIIAEVKHSDNSLLGFQNSLSDLLELIEKRGKRYVNEKSESRKNRKKQRPNKSYISVNGRKGLILDRIRKTSVPSISGTSLKENEINSLNINDESLRVLYRTRQEIFIAEGMRLTDMGVKLVLSNPEISQNKNINMGDKGTKAVIPTFIDAIKTELDDFTYDVDAKSVIIKHDVNKILIENKTSPLVLPFH